MITLCEFHSRKTAGAPWHRPCETTVGLEAAAMGESACIQAVPDSDPFAGISFAL